MNLITKQINNKNSEAKQLCMVIEEVIAKRLSKCKSEN